MKKYNFCIVILTCCFLFLTSSQTKAQVVYMQDIVGYDQNARTIFGYSRTSLDFYAGLYYDPAVLGELYSELDNEIPLDAGNDRGFGSFFDAEVYLYSTFYRPSTQYCTFGTHFVVDFTYHVVGRLGICITTPIDPPPPSPTPTPTPQCFGTGKNAVPCPTPTPTPSPTPQGADLILKPYVLRPTGTTGGENTADVEVRVTPARAGWRVSLQLIRVANSGGHIDAHHDGNAPLGHLRLTRGQTNSSGIFRTIYTPSHIGEQIMVVATIENLFSIRRDMYVGFIRLFDMPVGDNYRLIGSRDPHPSNHWGDLGTTNGLREIANDYKLAYYGNNPIPDDDKLAYNDMSLELGGKFDLPPRLGALPNWADTGSHHEHREGINCDVRCCQNPGNVPRDRWENLIQIFFDRGSTRTLDETTTANPHWHLRFEFGQLRAPAHYTPGNFADMTWAETFDRQATDAEWLVWTERLEQAKAQGQPQLLAEAKTLERERFLSQEYIARNRTDEEFISDVFRSYLLREPTEKEMSNWLDVLNGIPSQPNNRSTFLTQFENIQEFANLIYSLVDERPPQICDLAEEQQCIFEGGIWDSNDCFCFRFPQDSR